jgi:lysophospholipase L1-like esterase
MLFDGLDVLVSGRVTADKIIEPNGPASPSIYQGKTFVLADTFIWKVLTKKAERTRLNLFSNTAAIFNCTFDLDNGTCSGTGATIAGKGNGWFECTVTGVASASGTTNFQHRIYPASGGHPYVGDGVSGLFLQQSDLSINGGANSLNAPTDFSSAPWTKSAGVTVASNTGLYLGLLSDPGKLGAHDDGSAALVGKKWTALGSSITAQAFYTTPLADLTGMILTNLGVSGGSLGAASNGHYGSLLIYNQIAIIPVDAEIVTLEAGINDFGAAEVPLGTLNDTTTATFYGALFAAVTAIRARAPSAKVVFITPYSGGPGHASHKILRVNGRGNTLDQFMKAVRDVATLTGYPFIDVGGKSGIGYFTADAYTSDQLHLNAVGGLRHGTFDAEEFRRLSRSGCFGA